MEVNHSINIFSTAFIKQNSEQIVFVCQDSLHDDHIFSVTKQQASLSPTISSQKYFGNVIKEVALFQGLIESTELVAQSSVPNEICTLLSQYAITLPTFQYHQVSAEIMDKKIIHLLKECNGDCTKNLDQYPISSSILDPTPWQDFCQTFTKGIDPILMEMTIAASFLELTMLQHGLTRFYKDNSQMLKDEILKQKQEMIACYTIIRIQIEELEKMAANTTKDRNGWAAEKRFEERKQIKFEQDTHRNTYKFSSISSIWFANVSSTSSALGFISFGILIFVACGNAVCWLVS